MRTPACNWTVRGRALRPQCNHQVASWRGIEASKLDSRPYVAQVLLFRIIAQHYCSVSSLSDCYVIIACVSEGLCRVTLLYLHTYSLNFHTSFTTVTDIHLNLIHTWLKSNVKYTIILLCVLDNKENKWHFQILSPPVSSHVDTLLLFSILFII